MVTWEKLNVLEILQQVTPLPLLIFFEAESFHSVDPSCFVEVQASFPYILAAFSLSLSPFQQTPLVCLVLSLPCLDIQKHANLKTCK